MEALLKQMSEERFKFSKENPLADLKLEMNAIFPAVLALKPEIGGKAAESASGWSNREHAVSKKDVESSSLQKPSGQEVSKKDIETTSYSLVYFNPETNKAEVVKGSVSLAYEDETQQAIEESLGQRSAHGIFLNIGGPLIKEKVNEDVLNEILRSIKLDSPDPFGGGTGVQIKTEKIAAGIVEKHGDQIIALEVAESRREAVEKKLDEHIIIVEDAIANLRKKGSKMPEILETLPPLTHERMIALCEKRKNMPKKEIVDLLERDTQFLKAMRNRVENLSISDILAVALKIMEINPAQVTPKNRKIAK